MKGLSGFQLKLIGIVLMTFDHIYQYFGFLGIPVYFNWLGRVVASIFIFMAVEGYCHSSNINRYLRRLYIASLLMGLGNIALSTLVERPDMQMIPNNIFAGIFLTVLYIHSFNLMEEGFLSRKIEKIRVGLLMSALPILWGIISVGLWSFSENIYIDALLSALIPNPLTSEGGIVLIVMGLLIYYARGDKLKVVARHSFISILTIDYSDIGFSSLFYENYQWLMIFAGVFIYLYNGERGYGVKYFFYVYYPLHIYIFYIISSLIMVQLY